MDMDDTERKSIQNKNVKYDYNVENKTKISYLNIILLTLNTSTGYFFFGYNLCVFNVMQENLSLILNWNSQKQIFISIISAIIPFGAIFGSLSAGKIASKIGKKNTLILFDCLGILSSFITIIKNTYAIIFSRLIQGYCIGAFSTIVPLYISEYIPVEILGHCGILYNTRFCLSILISFCLGMILPDPIEVNNNWWRFMFLFSSIFLLINIFLFLFCFKHDTPKYLFQSKNIDDAEKVLNVIYINELDIEYTIKLYENEDKQDVPYSELCSKKYYKRLILCIIINIIQQCTLISGIGLYTNLIFLKNIDQNTATFFTVMTGLAELVASFLTIFFIEIVGRKFLFLV